MNWTRGQQTVDGLLGEGRLALVTGAAADGTAWLVSAQALLSAVFVANDSVSLAVRNTTSESRTGRG